MRTFDLAQYPSSPAALRDCCLELIRRFHEKSHLLKRMDLPADAKTDGADLAIMLDCLRRFYPAPSVMASIQREWEASRRSLTDEALGIERIAAWCQQHADGATAKPVEADATPKRRRGPPTPTQKQTDADAILIDCWRQSGLTQAVFEKRSKLPIGQIRRVINRLRHRQTKSK